MPKPDHFNHFVDLSHLTAAERRKAAGWALEKFGENRVEVMSPLEHIGRYGTIIKPGFWFLREQDLHWFILKWGR